MYPLDPHEAVDQQTRTRWWGSDALVSLKPEGIPRLGEVRVDATVAAFAAFVAMLTGLLFGSIPALQVTRGALVGALKEGGRGAMTGRRSLRMRSGLVVAELALAVALLDRPGADVRRVAA